MRDSMVARTGRVTPVVMAVLALVIVGAVVLWPERNAPKSGATGTLFPGSTTTAPKGTKTTGPATTTPVAPVARRLRAYDDNGTPQVSDDDVCALLNVDEVRTAMQVSTLSINKKRQRQWAGLCEYDRDPNDPVATNVMLLTVAQGEAGNIPGVLISRFGGQRVVPPYQCDEVTAVDPNNRCVRIVRYPNLGEAAYMVQTPATTTSGTPYWSPSQLLFQKDGVMVTVRPAPGIVGTDGIDRMLQVARLVASRIPANLTMVPRPCPGKFAC